MTLDNLNSNDGEGHPRPLLPAAKIVRSWRWFGATCGLGGGLACVLFGSIITAVTWLIGPASYGPFLRKLGTILLVLTIPLLIFGAHCLDLMERQQHKESAARLNAHS